MVRQRNTALKFPRGWVWIVVGITALPAVCNLCGMRFSAGPMEFDIAEYERASDGERDDELYRAMQGVFIHCLLEWTAASVAMFTAGLACVHYFLRKDLMTPIIGTALCFAGMIDVFHTLASLHLIGSVADRAEFIPFTWMISRLFHSMILVLGTAPLAFRRSPEPTQHGLRFIILSAILFGLAAYALIIMCASIPNLPRAVQASPILKRPWDLAPLGLYLLAGGITLPRLYRKYPSLFARGLQVSVIPLVVSQLYAAFDYSHPYDNGANVASFLKIVGYCVPLAGLIFDYANASRAQAQLAAAREQLNMAHDIQMSLLPRTSPVIPGFEIAGQTRFAETVGGDFFDYIPLADGQGNFSDSAAFAAGFSWLVTVADVSGHDPGASLLMVNTRAYLRALAQESPDPAVVLEKLNRFVSRDVDGRRFVTMFIARIDPHAAKVHWSAAGHAATLYRRNGATEELNASTIPVGVDISRFRPELSCSELLAGDIVLISTDGLAETKSPAGEEFGKARIEQVVRENLSRSTNDLLKALQSAVGRHRGTQQLADDETIVLIRRQIE